MKLGAQHEIRRGRLGDKPWTAWLSSRGSTPTGIGVPEIAPRHQASRPPGHWIADNRKSAAARVSPGKQSDRLMHPINTRTSGSTRPLTERELDVLSYLPTRLSTTDIAANLQISPNTVKTHLKNIYHKLEARSRNEAIVHAVQRHLISDTSAAVLMPKGR